MKNNSAGENVKKKVKGLEKGYLHHSFLATTKPSASFISRHTSHRQHRLANLWVVSTYFKVFDFSFYSKLQNYGSFKADNLSDLTKQVAKLVLSRILNPFVEKVVESWIF